MPWAKIDAETEIYYEVHGEGEPLVLIMGTGADRTAWAYQTRFFVEAGFRVVTPDNRGVGLTKTATKADEYSAALLADDVAAVMADAGISSADISGMSLGSAIAQELTIRHPGLVKTLQLHVTWGRTDRWLEWVFKNFLFTVENADPQVQAEMATLWACSPALVADDTLRDQWLAMRLNNPNPPTPEGVRGQWSADIKHDALDRLSSIECPTLVTAGELDMLVPQRYGREVAEAIPGSRFHLFTGPRSSHVNCIEMPEEFNRVGLEFLRERES